MFIIYWNDWCLWIWSHCALCLQVRIRGRDFCCQIVRYVLHDPTLPNCIAVSRSTQFSSSSGAELASKVGLQMHFATFSSTATYKFSFISDNRYDHSNAKKTWWSCSSFMTSAAALPIYIYVGGLLQKNGQSHQSDASCTDNLLDRASRVTLVTSSGHE